MTVNLLLISERSERLLGFPLKKLLFFSSFQARQIMSDKKTPEWVGTRAEALIAAYQEVPLFDIVAGHHMSKLDFNNAVLAAIVHMENALPKVTLVEGHRRGEHIGRWITCDLCMASPTPPPPSETKLRALLRKLETEAIMGHDEETAAARSSLESLYRELLEEKRIAEASFCAFHTREYLYAGLPIHRKAIECRNEEIDNLSAELSALRSLQADLRAENDRLRGGGR